MSQQKLEVLNSFKALDVCPSRQTSKIITVQNDQSLKEALLVLAKNNILSAPVYDSNTGSCVGLIDVLDCATFTRDTYYQNNETSQWKNYLLQFSFDIEKVETVMNISGKNPYIPMKTNDPLMNLLGEFANGVHRIPIFPSPEDPNYEQEKENVVAICSQMTLFRYLFGEIDKKHPEIFQDFKKVHVRDVMDKKAGKVVNVKESQLAIEAIKAISDKGISAVGVLSDDNDKLIGCISASDLQGFIDEDYHHLASPVLEFQRMSREKKGLKSPQEKHHGQDLVFCKIETHTMGDVIDRLLQEKVHRIFVMNNSMENIGVISLTDVFKLVYDFIMQTQQ